MPGVKQVESVNHTFDVLPVGAQAAGQGSNASMLVLVCDTRRSIAAELQWSKCRVRNWSLGW